ncbi:MAG: hypothetical protein ACK5QW_01745 [Cyanobacteriota bacterium]
MPWEPLGWLKNKTTLDYLIIQRTLTILEDRFRELQEISEKRFEAWEKERNEMQRALEEQKVASRWMEEERTAQLQVNAGMVEKVTTLENSLTQQKQETRRATQERDALVQEKAAVLERVASLDKALAMQKEETRRATEERDALAKAKAVARETAAHLETAIREHKEGLLRLRGLAQVSP